MNPSLASHARPSYTHLPARLPQAIGKGLHGQSVAATAHGSFLSWAQFSNLPADSVRVRSPAHAFSSCFSEAECVSGTEFCRLPPGGQSSQDVFVE